jgi:hypothetical protein
MLSISASRIRIARPVPCKIKLNRRWVCASTNSEHPLALGLCIGSDLGLCSAKVDLGLSLLRSLGGAERAGAVVRADLMTDP